MSGYYNKNNAFKKKSASKSGPCANPVFDKWISEWKENAVARDLNSKHTYNKVIFPIDFKFFYLKLALGMINYHYLKETLIS